MIEDEHQQTFSHNEHLILISYNDLENHNWMKYRMKRDSEWSNNFSLRLSYPAEALDSLQIEALDSL